jgi:hypothetical protein
MYYIGLDVHKKTISYRLQIGLAANALVHPFMFDWILVMVVTFSEVRHRKAVARTDGTLAQALCQTIPKMSRRENGLQDWRNSEHPSTHRTWPRGRTRGKGHRREEAPQRPPVTGLIILFGVKAF